MVVWPDLVKILIVNFAKIAKSSVFFLRHEHLQAKFLNGGVGSMENVWYAYASLDDLNYEIENGEKNVYYHPQFDTHSKWGGGTVYGLLVYINVFLMYLYILKTHTSSILTWNSNSKSLTIEYAMISHGYGIQKHNCR